MRDLKEEFNNYEANNPHVYEEFEKNALELAMAGVKKTSAWLIVNKMRWDSMLSVNTDLEYSIPNDYIGIFSRRFMKMHPEYNGFFTVKSSKYNLDELV